MASRRITIYLLREDVETFFEALNPDKREECISLDVSEQSGIIGQFYYTVSTPRDPGWLEFVSSILEQPASDVSVSSASALLLLWESNRIFAVTFGHARWFLDQSRFERQFGLRVCLNRIDSDEIRSLDTKTFDDLVLHTSKQTSKGAGLSAFGLDISTDILRAVTGKPRDKKFAKTLAGSDALFIEKELVSTELPGLCRELLQAFQEDTYKDNFSWIDQLGVVNDKDEIGRLDKKLVERLRSRDFEGAHLAVPEPVDLMSIQEFEIDGESYSELDLGQYLERVDARGRGLTRNKLNNKVCAYTRDSPDSEDERSWKIYNCIVASLREDGKVYQLVDGQWFRVHANLVERVDSFMLRCLSEPNIKLIPAKKGESEECYNKRLVRKSQSTRYRFDRAVRSPGGTSNTVEMCDVLTLEGEFVHVKHKYSSSTLSHLFAQGSVAAQAFVSDQVYRAKYRQKISKETSGSVQSRWLEVIPDRDQDVNRDGYQVTYAVISGPGRNDVDWLPFFSRLNLMVHATRIRQVLGIKVAIGRVPIE